MSLSRQIEEEKENKKREIGEMCEKIFYYCFATLVALAVIVLLIDLTCFIF
jgi:cell division protein FtsL